MTSGRSGTSSVRGALILALIGLLIVFAIQNVATVEVNFLIWNLKMPRALLYFIIFAIGALIGWLARYFATRPERLD